MKLLLSLVFIMIPTLAFSVDFEMKPGLWDIEMSIEVGGKKVDPMAEIKKSMEKMPKAQQEMMQAQFSKANLNLSQLCYTKEMINSPENFKTDEDDDRDCTYKVKKKTPSSLEMDFTCEDGSKGTFNMNVSNKTSYKIITKGTNPKGEKMTMNYSGKFKQSNCK